MTWLISNAMMQDFENSLSSLEPVEEFLEAICSDGEPSAPSSGNTIPQAYCAPDRMTAFSRLSRFGMTFAPLTDYRGEALLTWYLADSHVRTSASQEPAQGLTVNDPAYGEKWPASLAKYDHASHSLKTAQLSLLGDSTGCSVTLPRSGTMRSGECYLRPTLALHMSGKGSGLWPTPTATLGTHGGLVTERKAREGGTLIEAVSARMFPTPTATAHKGWSKNHNRAETDDRIDYTIEREAYQSGTLGRLNPEWVEWLMGWPLGHTDLKPLGMDRFREWQQQHSPACAIEQDGNV